MIKRAISSIGRFFQLRMLASSVVHEENGVKVVDVQSPPSAAFKRVIAESLRIVREFDHYRYARIVTCLDWIIFMPLGFRGARYLNHIKACEIDFSAAERRLKESPDDFLLYCVYYGTVLIHEATHGKINRMVRRSLSESEQLRCEAICKSEEHKFLSKVRASGAELPIPEVLPLDVEAYKRVYALSYWGHARRQVWRIIRGRHQ